MNEQDKKAWREACDKWHANSGGKDLGEFMFEAALNYLRENEPSILNMKLPVSVRIGGGVFCQGVSLKTVVNKLKLIQNNYDEDLKTQMSEQSVEGKGYNTKSISTVEKGLIECPDKGPWSAGWGGTDLYIFSENFNHDVSLKVTGDFGSIEDRQAYGEQMAAWMNSKITPEVHLNKKLLAASKLALNSYGSSFAKDAWRANNVDQVLREAIAEAEAKEAK